MQELKEKRAQVPGSVHGIGRAFSMTDSIAPELKQPCSGRIFSAQNFPVGKAGTIPCADYGDAA